MVIFLHAQGWCEHNVCIKAMHLYIVISDISKVRAVLKSDIITSKLHTKWTLFTLERERAEVAKVHEKSFIRVWQPVERGGAGEPLRLSEPLHLQ